MLLAALLALPLAHALQDDGLRTDPQDPFAFEAQFESGTEPRRFVWSPTVDGNVHFWARTDDRSVLVRLLLDGLDPLSEEGEELGGAWTEYAVLECFASETIEFVVDAEAAGLPVTLRVVQCPGSKEEGAAFRRWAVEYVAIVDDEETEAAILSARMAELIERTLADSDAWRGLDGIDVVDACAAAAESFGLTELLHRCIVRSQALRARLFPADDPQRLEAERNLVAVLLERDEISEALALAEYVVDVMERFEAVDEVGLWEARSALSTALSAMGRFDEERGLLEQVISGFEGLIEPDDERLVNARSNYAIVLENLDREDLALAAREELTAVLAEHRAPGDERLLEHRLELAVSYSKSGAHDRAVELARSVVRDYELHFDPDHRAAMRAQIRLAAILRMASDPTGANAILARVWSLADRYLVESDEVMEDLLIQQVEVSSNLGDLQASIEMARQLLGIRTATLDETHSDYHVALELLSEQLMLAGRYREAAIHMNQLLELRKSSLAADSIMLAKTYVSSGTLAWQVGQLETAEEAFTRALDVFERRLPADHQYTWIAKGNLCSVLDELGDVERSRELSAEFLQWSRSRYEVGDANLLAAIQNRATGALEIGDHALLFELATEFAANAIVRARRLASMSPRSARSGAIDLVMRLSHLLRWEAALPAELAGEHTAACFELLETVRRSTARSVHLAREARESEDLRSLELALSGARRSLAAESQRQPEQADAIEAWRMGLVELAGRRDRLESELAAALAERGFAVVRPTVAAVAAGLAEGEALVAFHRYWQRSPLVPETGAPSPATRAVLAFVVTPDGAAHRVELGASDELEQLVAAWRAALGRPIERGLEVEEAVDEEELLGRELRERLLDSCLALLEGRPTRLFVVPDDFLHLVPFDALPDASGAPIGGAFGVQIATSTAGLIQPLAPPTGSGTLVAFGGVDYGASIASQPPTGSAAASVTAPVADRGGAASQFSKLLQSRFEVQSVALLGEEFLGVAPQLRTRAEATKDALIEAAPRARFLHVATHGWFAPAEVSVAGAGDDDRAVSLLESAARATLTGFLPETLCGLALAGANHGSAGILTAEELSTLDLTNCELAVLSACETNVGIRRAGRGIQSLQTALHAAGARTAITSLWKVDDAATRQLFELFYTGLWEDELGTADALWRAKMALRADGHPLRDWAGWVLTGE